MAYTWSNTLSIGVDEIDRQHKELVEAINNFSNACMNAKGAQEIESTLNYLTNYTKTHFSDEELIMLQSNYPLIQEHKALHEELINKLTGYVVRFKEKGASSLLLVEMNNLIGQWLVDHIMEEDMKLGKYLSNR